MTNKNIAAKALLVKGKFCPTAGRGKRGPLSGLVEERPHAAVADSHGKDVVAEGQRSGRQSTDEPEGHEKRVYG